MLSRQKAAMQNWTSLVRKRERTIPVGARRIRTQEQDAPEEQLIDRLGVCACLHTENLLWAEGG